MSVRAKKHLGQHFLKDEQVAQSTAEAVDAYANTLLEVGAGTGMLSKYLLGISDNLVLLDVDAESIAYLRQDARFEKAEIRHEDFLRVDLNRWGGEVSVIGNFPYNISSQIVFKVLENRVLIPQMVGMFQKEVAKRIVEKPGSKNYGILSVLVQSYYETEYLIEVAPGAFDPPPKVQSAVIKLTRRENHPKVEYESLRKVVKAAFNQRRKKLSNALKPLITEVKPEIEQFMDRRAESLSVKDFHALTQTIIT